MPLTAEEAKEFYKRIDEVVKPIIDERLKNIMGEMVKHHEAILKGFEELRYPTARRKYIMGELKLLISDLKVFLKEEKK